MPHRRDPFPEAPVLPEDPLGRFRDIYLAFEARKTWTSDLASLRLTALTLLTADGDAQELTEHTYQADLVLKEGSNMWSALSPSTRFLLAANIVKNNDDPAAFWPAVEQTKSLFRAHKIPKGQANETLAAMVFRNLHRGGPTTEDDAARFKRIYAELKRYHWWLTNAGDYPMCAFLTTQRGSADEIGRGTEAMYQALRKHASLYRGDALQAAANVLYASGLQPELAAERAASIIGAFREQKRKIRVQDYDELALMCFLSLPVERIVGLVAQYEAGLVELRRSRLDSSWIFSIAVSLAFVHLLGQMKQLDALVDLKTVMDMQAIVAARAAAVAVSAAV